MAANRIRNPGLPKGREFDSFTFRLFRFIAFKVQRVVKAILDLRNRTVNPVLERGGGSIPRLPTKFRRMSIGCMQ